MTITVTTNKGKKDIDIPSGWTEVKTSAYQKMYSEDHNNDPAKLLSIVCDLPSRFLYDTKDERLTTTIIQCLSFLSDESFKSKPPPEFIIVKRKKGEDKIAIPKDVGRLSVGQNIHLRQKMEEVKVYEEMLAYACAIYLQPIYTNSDFDFDKAMALHDKILDLPIIEIYSLGFFLLNRLTKDGSGMINLCSLIYIRSYQKLIIARKLARWQRRNVLNLSTI